MDFEGYWQENKGFVGRVAFGAALFLVGLLVIDGLWAEDVARESSRLRRLERELAQPMYGVAERDQALAEHEALTRVVDELTAVVGFAPRPAMRLDPARGSAANQYLRAATDVRERVLLRAGRAGVSIEPGLGLPRLSPTRQEEIERMLEALDAIETVADVAIDAGVRRVDDIRVRLDPALSARGAPGAIERTLIDVSLTGDARALTRVLGATQRPGEPDATDHPAARLLRLQQAELGAARGRERELRLELTVVLPRLAAADAASDAPGQGEER